MAHSFECISTHPDRRKKIEPQYIDIYGPAPTTSYSETAFMDLSCIRNRELLPTVPFLPPRLGGWTLCNALPDLEAF